MPVEENTMPLPNSAHRGNASKLDMAMQDAWDGISKYSPPGLAIRNDLAREVIGTYSGTGPLLDGINEGMKAVDGKLADRRAGLDGNTAVQSQSPAQKNMPKPM